MTQNTLNFEQVERDAAMSTVLTNAGPTWQERATEVLRGLSGHEVTGEDVRLECARVGIEPHHHNAWGAMVATWVREGLLVATGRYQPMRAKGSHGRETKVYRVS